MLRAMYGCDLAQSFSAGSKGPVKFHGSLSERNSSADGSLLETEDSLLSPCRRSGFSLCFSFGFSSLSHSISAFPVLVDVLGFDASVILTTHPQ